jgi:hypothetical protein
MNRGIRQYFLRCVLLLFTAGRLLAADTDAFSPVVSYQFFDSLDNPGSGTEIISPVVSYQFFDWLGDENVDFASSPPVSYYFNGPPRIVTQPASQLARVGSNVTLSVAADATQPLSYQWRLNGQPLADTKGAAIALDSVQTGNSGLYSVVVSNAQGSVTSSDARLIVYDAPLEPQPVPPALLAATQTLSESQTAQPVTPTNAQLKVLVGTAVDRNKMTIVMTHGWNSSSEAWPTPMAAALAQAYASKANILAWDWRGNAAQLSPAAAAARTVSEGSALGGAVMDTLGQDYGKPIHFLGHSLGTLVNCAAADYIHGDQRPRGDARQTSQAFDPANTHMTLFDQAELVTAVKGIHVMFDPLIGFDKFTQTNGADQLRNFWSKVIPKNWTWIDNYISEVGLPHSEAVNVMLWRKNHAGLSESLFSPHGYAYEWYGETIRNPLSSAMGHRWSFERNSIRQAPIAPAYYLQSLETDAREMNLNVTNLFTAFSTQAAASSSRLIAYPTLKAAQGLHAIGTAVQGTYMNGIQYAGEMVANFGESFSFPKGTPVYLGTAGSTAAYFAPTSQSVATDLQANWDFQFSIQPGAPQPQQLPDGVQAAPVPYSNEGPVYTIIPVQVPNEAVGVSFEYSISGSAVDEFMTMGINTSNEYTMEAKFLDEGAWNGTPVIPASDFRNQMVDLVFALNGVSAPPAGTLSVRNIQFYIPPRPQLSLEKSGNLLTASWPLSSLDWTIETTTDLSDPNGWATVTEQPTASEFFHRMTFDVSGNDKAFFRLKK